MMDINRPSDPFFGANPSSDPFEAKRRAQDSAAEGIYQNMLIEREARAKARVVANGTIARLITEHKGPNPEPTPRARYGRHSLADLKDALDETHAHSIRQWQAGQGVVGPTGNENDFFFRGFNTPTGSAYEENQNFAYQHDMQATDADLQHAGRRRKKEYEIANRNSAIAGMYVLKTTGDGDKALAKTKEVFGAHGFKVKEHY